MIIVINFQSLFCHLLEAWMISDKNYSFSLKCFYHVLEWKYEQMQLHLLGIEVVLKDKDVLLFLLFFISQRNREMKSQG